LIYVEEPKIIYIFRFRLFFFKIFGVNCFVIYWGINPLVGLFFVRL